MIYSYCALFILSYGATIYLRQHRFWLWLPALVTLVFCALTTAQGVAPLPSYLVLAALVIWCQHSSGSRHRLALIVCVVYALLLAFRLPPTFDSVGPLAGHLLSELSGRWEIYAGIHKALIGLLLLPLVPWSSIDAGKITRHWPILVFGPMAIVLLAGLLGLAWDPKLSGFSLVFILANLSFVVISEEVFFRGVIQHQLHNRLGQGRRSTALAILISAGIFGGLHFAGGAFYVLLASAAGAVYGLAYWRLQSLWASVWCHLAVNAAHFILLQYPVPN